MDNGIKEKEKEKRNASRLFRECRLRFAALSAWPAQIMEVLIEY